MSASERLLFRGFKTLNFSVKVLKRDVQLPMPQDENAKNRTEENA